MILFYYMRWEVLQPSSKSITSITSILLKNRGIKDKKDFFEPRKPQEIKIYDLGIKKEVVIKALERINLAKKNKEKVIVYGDYDADGICATAILWEALHNYGIDALPYIPDRFEEGYGLKAENFSKSQISSSNLIICVDNGIVAYEGIEKAKELGIDVIVLDHHQKGTKKLSTSYILHSTDVCGSALAYFFVKEFTVHSSQFTELAAIGTIADQMPLVGINRSIVKYGLGELENTERLGFQALFENANIENIGTYEVNYIIAPRINAMGRLKHGIEALRLICTRKADKALELAKLLSKTNSERQSVVDIVVKHTLKSTNKDKVIVMADASYHEGVIGLAAGKLVEEYYRPAIVISKGEKVSRGSGRSIPGFDLISNLRNVSNLLIQAGGHKMAAGFSIETKNIKKFTKEINRISDELLTDELLERKLKIDCELHFGQINTELYNEIQKFEPFGQGNYPPLFCSKNVQIISSKKVGKEGKHLKLKLKQNEKILDAVWFNPQSTVDSSQSAVKVAFSVEENVWNNKTTLQLKVRDIKVN